MAKYIVTKRGMGYLIDESIEGSENEENKRYIL